MKLHRVPMVSLALAMAACSPPPSDVPWVTYGVALSDHSDSVFLRAEMSQQGMGPVLTLTPMFLTPVAMRGLRIADDTSSIEFAWPNRTFGDCRLERRSERSWAGACRSESGVREVVLGGMPRPDLGAHIPPGSVDLEIIDNARERLADPESWNRHDDRICDHEDAADRVSLFCALFHASIAVTGRYLHGRPAIEFPRYIIRETAWDRVTAHALRDFNNNGSTSHEEVLQLLDDARTRLVRAIEDSEAVYRR